ncbi:MAG: ribosomal protein S18 acetylase RimI-like enzyme [Paraglaciecola sp.]|jgi:ribosomal protein S18 acetylase RimI-like enzyme
MTLPLEKATKINMNRLLSNPSDGHITQIMTWFANEAQLKIWSGPNFRYPFYFTSFKSDLNLTSLNSFSLLSSQNDLLAFGQYYFRAGKCHLGRLVVNPAFRGQAIVAELINGLSIAGKKELQVNACSLFVYNHNTNAIKAYEKLGFQVETYVEDIPLENCVYMVKRDLN